MGQALHKRVLKPQYIPRVTFVSDFRIVVEFIEICEEEVRRYRGIVARKCLNGKMGRIMNGEMVETVKMSAYTQEPTINDSDKDVDRNRQTAR